LRHDFKSLGAEFFARLAAVQAESLAGENPVDMRDD
jgi:hypothetical protein